MKKIMKSINRPVFKAMTWSTPSALLLMMFFSFSFIVFDYAFGVIPTRSGFLSFDDDPERYRNAYNVFLFLGYSFLFIGIMSIAWNFFICRKEKG